jgi:hypothetical protein
MPKMSRSTRQAVRTSGWHRLLLLERHERKLEAMSWPPMQRSKCQWTPSVGRFCSRRKIMGHFFESFILLDDNLNFRKMIIFVWLTN